MARPLVVLSVGLLGLAAPTLFAQTFSDYMAPPEPSSATFYYFTCRYTAYHFDDYGPLGIDVLVEALDPDGRVLASERRAEGSGQLFLDVIAAVPVAELSSRDYHCRSSPFVPSAPERMTSGKIACEDERNDILREYAQYEVNWIPTCDDFASGGGTAHFSWNELNGGFREGNPHSPWGIVTSRLTDGLEATRANYGAPIYLSSGYRCPHGNRRVNGVQYSLHMHGRAADMFKNASHTWTEAEFNDLKAAAERTNPVESSSYDTYPDHHYHAAW